MAEKYIQLRNVSDQPQYVFDPETKRRWDLAERSILAMPEKVAKLFLQGDRARYVQIYSPNPIPEIPGEPVVWVANMTGNPFAPEKRANRQGVMVDNPNKKPMSLARSMHVGQVSNKDKDGYLVVTNHPPLTIEIPPFVRVRCPLSTALWLEGRDNQQEPEGTGKLIRCRAPTAFEPNVTWEYDDIRVYAAIVDARVFDIVSDYPPRAEGPDMEAAKASLLQKLFFKLVDDRVTLPPKDYFDAENAKLKAMVAAAASKPGNSQQQRR